MGYYCRRKYYIKMDVKEIRENICLTQMAVSCKHHIDYWHSIHTAAASDVVPWLRRAVAVILPGKSGFDPRPISVVFVVDSVE
jgi:hypothetical protein